MESKGIRLDSGRQYWTTLSDSGVQESRHSPLRDIQPQSSGLADSGTEMLGTSAC